jgi:hypothetical protein
MLELNEQKCLAVLRAKVQRKLASGQTKSDKLIQFASGHSLLSSLTLVKFYYLTFKENEQEPLGHYRQYTQSAVRLQFKASDFPQYFTLPNNCV